MQIMKIFQTTAVFLLLIGTSFIPSAVAHTNGASYEEVVGDYLLDIGYNPETIFANDVVRFDFGLYPIDQPTESTDVFSDVWVVITQESELVFSGNLHRPSFNVIAFSTIFNQSGEYKLHARFEQSGEYVAESTFNFMVADRVIDYTVYLSFFNGAFVLLGFILGSGFWYLWGRQLNSSLSQRK